VNISALDDTILFRVEHHYVAPTVPSPLPNGYYKFSQTHYWTVNFAGGYPDGVMTFRLMRSNNQLDHNLFDGGYDLNNLKLMYRPNGHSAWTSVPYTRTGSPYNSIITTTEIRAGQYCFAIADEDVSVSDLDNVRLNIYPNPADDALTLRTDPSRADKAVIFDSLGRKVKTLRVSDEIQQINISNLPSGNYVIVLYQKGKSVARTMFVKAQ
jgi:hypothetical protein